MSGNKEKNDISRLVDFYDGKSILITGAAGFVGGVLLEILLRCCMGIESIYLLLREKKGISPEARIKQIFEKAIFTTLREKQPGVFNKVHVVAGDISLPDLGMSNENLQKIVRDVSIVFHCAASVSFRRPLKYMLLHNVRGLDNVIEICKKLKVCEVLVYTSTAYSNCNRKLKIEERVYRLPYPAQMFLDALDNEEDEMLQNLASECKPEWPNHYVFSKCIAENLLVEKCCHIPAVIIRPSIVAAVWRGILPGYSEQNSNVAQLLLAIATGFLKVLRAHPDTSLDIVPADVIANAHIVAAYGAATKRFSSPHFVNCTSIGSCEFRLRLSKPILLELIQIFPPPNMFRFSNNYWITDNPIKGKFLNIYEHYIPAIALDLLLIFRGKRPRVVSKYRFLDEASEKGSFFLTRHWTYETRNFKNLQLAVMEEERKMFYTDLTGLTIREFLLNAGAAFYDWKCDKLPMVKRMKLARRTYYFSLFVQMTVVLFICWLFNVLAYRIW